MTAGEPLGTAAQEASRLVESLQGWWRENQLSGAPREQARTWVDDAADAADAADAGHPPSGTCRYCPWCRAVAAAQQVRPEVVEHLVAGVESFAAALRELSRPAADAPHDAAHEGPGRPTSDRSPHPPHGPRTVTIPVEDEPCADQHPDEDAADEEDH